MQKRKRLFNSGHSFVRIPKEMTAVVLLLISGIIIGVLTAKNGSETIQKCTETIFNSFFSLHSDQSISSGIITSVGVSLAFQLTAFACAFCAVGAPIIASIPLVRGLGIGLISGYLYSAYKLQGIGYCALIIFPGVIISFIALVYITTDSFKMSLNAFGLIFGKSRPGNETEKAKNFIIRQFFYFLIFLLAAVADGITAKLFSGFFSF